MLKTLGSIKLTAVMFAVIALACIVGTLIPQQAEPGWYREHYGTVGARILIGLHLPDVFHSWWFMGSLVLFGLNLLACTVNRKPWSLRQLGFLLTHAGVIVLLVGALLGVIAAEKGEIRLEHGQTGDSYISARTGQPEPLGFQVRLDDFKIERYPKPAQLIALQKGHRTETVALDKNLEASVGHDEVKYSVKVLEVYPDFAQRTLIAEDPAQPFAPTIELESDLAAEPLILKAQSDSSFSSGDALHLAYVWLPEGETIESEIARATGAAAPALIVGAGDEEIRLAVEPGARGELPKAGLQIEVLEYFERFQLGEDGRPASPPTAPVNPCARVKLTAGETSRTQFVFAKFPDFGAMHGDNEPEHRLRLIVPEGHGAAHRVFIFEGEETPPTLVHITGNAVIAHTALALGEKVVIEDAVHMGIEPTMDCCDRWVKLLGSYKHPAFSTETVNRSNDYINPAARLRVSGPDGEIEGWSAMFGPPLSYADGKLFVGYVLPDIKTYRSDVSVLQNDAVVRQARVEVNAPLSFDGFSFYQANADPQNPTWSGLEVVHDPGIHVVYAGLILVTAGVIFIFSIKPYLKRGVSNG